MKQDQLFHGCKGSKPNATNVDQQKTNCDYTHPAEAKTNNGQDHFNTTKRKKVGQTRDQTLTKHHD